ncbi:hypothetical protein V6Z11_A06G113700 [Gossypium hirsutum]
MVVIFHIIVSLEASQSHIFSSLFAIVLHPFRHRSNWVMSKSKSFRLKIVSEVVCNPVLS